MIYTQNFLSPCSEHSKNIHFKMPPGPSAISYQSLTSFKWLGYFRVSKIVIATRRHFRVLRPLNKRLRLARDAEVIYFISCLQVFFSDRVEPKFGDSWSSC